MTTKDEALRMALEALEGTEALLTSMDVTHLLVYGEVDKAITACREALAQPAGERGELIRKAMRKAYSLGQTYWQQADSEFTSHHKKADVTQAKFTALVEETAALLSSDAQPSEWVGLTSEEIEIVRKETVDQFIAAIQSAGHWKQDPAQFARAIEAKLREKNARKDMPAAEDKAGGDEPVEFWNAVDGWVSVPAESADKPAAWVYPEFWEHLEKVGCGTAYRTEGDGRHPLFTRPQPQAQAMRDALTVGIGITSIDPRDIYSDPKEKNSG